MAKRSKKRKLAKEKEDLANAATAAGIGAGMGAVGAGLGLFLGGPIGALVGGAVGLASGGIPAILIATGHGDIADAIGKAATDYKENELEACYGIV